MTESHSDRYSKVGNYEPVAQRQEMVIGTLALLLCKQGSGPRDGATGVQIPPVFYRTSSPPVPSGAAAQKPVAQRQEMVIGTLALLSGLFMVGF